METPFSAPDSSEDQPRWLTTTEAADIAAVSYNTIRNWENAGRLHPQKEVRLLSNGQRREIKVFNQAELQKFIRRRGSSDDGEVAARAFELFGEGRSIREVVVELRQTPDRVEQLHNQWARCGSSDLVITPVAQRELERLLGPFVSVADIVEHVAELAKKVQASAAAMGKVSVAARSRFAVHARSASLCSPRRQRRRRYTGPDPRRAHVSMFSSPRFATCPFVTIAIELECARAGRSLEQFVRWMGERNAARCR